MIRVSVVSTMSIIVTATYVSDVMTESVYI